MIEANLQEEKTSKQTNSELLCFHCGQFCPGNDISIDDKHFCCEGCKTVFEILDQNKLCQYYDINRTPGISAKGKSIQYNYEFLDDSEIKSKLISFTDGNITTVTFFIRQMHCSSCIWLLENLYKFNSGIIFSQTNFIQKQLTIKYLEKEISLRKVVELLHSIGYAPEINLEDIEGEKRKQLVPKSLYYKIGIAGFCFGNIMLLSFPEYLSFINNVDPFLKSVFGYVIILLSLPVFFYCSSDYFFSAFRALKRKVINIDFPLSLGILVLFLRSLYEIFSHSGAGYMDSLAGLVFFLLSGKLFQIKTFETLNFERNYKSYFPVAVTLIKDGSETSIPASKLKPGDRIAIRNGELIPCDTVLIKGKGFIDYSFVTGESRPIEKLTGNMLYAGGRQLGTAIEVEVIKETSQSYLTQLWNQDFSHQNENHLVTLSNVISKYFTIVILIIASAAFIYWFQFNLNTALNVFTAVLIIACPCALALSTPFTFGNTLRIFGRNKFYLKNTSVIEKLAKINSIVFDKTGTLTKANESVITYDGEILSEEDKILIKSIVRNSTHPLSRKINESIKTDLIFETIDYKEFPGAGLSGRINGKIVRVGSRSITVSKNDQEQKPGEKDIDTRVYFSVDDNLKGSYKISNCYREDLHKVIRSLSSYDLSLLSGDNESEKEKLRQLFSNGSEIYFRQSPEDKLNFVRNLQQRGQRVLMIGDGLNDAGALLMSDCGISVTEDISNFSPACDAILDASAFNKLGDFLKLSKLNLNVIKASFFISLVYNLIGLSFALKGNLSPVIAAILMPLSSVTVVGFTTAATNFLARRRRL